MRKARRPKSAPKGPQGPDSLSTAQQTKLEKLASQYGIRAPRPGDTQDRKYTRAAPDKAPPTLYEMLARAVGVARLDVAERVVFVVLGSLLVSFLGAGLAISSEAFVKASGRTVADDVDAMLKVIEGAFTPLLVVFVALSSLLGLYKQSQLASGATSYDAVKDNDRDR